MTRPADARTRSSKLTSMTDPRSQATYQLRLGWGASGLTTLASSGIVVVVDAIGDSRALAAQAAALPHTPSVYLASLRNATATAEAVVAEQIERGGRTAINLILAGTESEPDEAAGFAVEDYLAAGAVADALSRFGLDHSAPDVAVATEGFRPLTRALKHLFSASAAGLELAAEGRRDQVRAAADLDAESEAMRFSQPS